MSLSEIFELFEGAYTEVQIKNALDAIGVEPDEEGLFDPSVVESLENALRITEEAIKQLPQSASVQQTQELAIQIASERAIELNIDSDALEDIVELVVSKGISKAVFLHQLEQQVVEKVSADLASQELQDLNDESARKIAAFTNILKNPKKLDKIIQEYGGSSEEEVTQRQQNLAAETDFNVDAFLVEMEGEKKPTTIEITSISDTKKLASALLQRCKKKSTNLKTVVS